MITLFNNLLRHLLMSRIDEIKDEVQVRFQPPNEEWRTYVSNLVVAGEPANALNVYLVDLRENRQLRTNERVRTVVNGMVSEEPGPPRVDCHYLISAWSPATVSPAVEPTMDEQALLYKAMAALMHNEVLIPRKVYDPDNQGWLPPGFPPDLKDEEFPATVLPAEGFPKLAEFWGTMGNVHPWKPVIYFMATIPVILEKAPGGPMVTTRIIEYRIMGKPETAETWIEISGQVRTGSPPAPVPEALVHLENAAGTLLQSATTDQEGRFRFGRLLPGNYTLRAQSQGTEASRSITVPLAEGITPKNYDVEIS